jgi:putative addiction module component (TIGR02574 family)
MRPSARISSPSTPRRRRFPRPRAPNARIEAWLDEQTRAVAAKARPEAKQRLFGELIKDAGATLLQRLVYLRLLETNGLRTVPIVTGGWDSRGYKDFREVAPRETRKARAAIWCPRAERGQSATAIIGVPFGGVEHRALALPATSRPRYPAFMATSAAAKVIAEALALSDEERAAVAEELLASLDPTQPDDSPEAVAAFKAALDRRWAAYQSGEEPGIPWPEVRARLRARLNRG